MALLLVLLLLGSAYGGDFTIFPEAPKAIFWNSFTGTGPTSDTWHTLNVVQFGVPASASAIFIQGQINITGGTDSSMICNSYVFFRKDPGAFSGDVVSPDWFGIGQALISLLGQGIRTPVASFVPLVNGAFAWKWTRSTQNEWPVNCSYGGNFNIQGYVN